MKIKRRFIMLGSVTAFLLIASLVYITFHGHSYTESINKEALLDPGQSFSEIEDKIKVTPQPEGIVDVGKIYCDGKDICVEFDSRKEGDTNVTIATDKYSYPVSEATYVTTLEIFSSLVILPTLTTLYPSSFNLLTTLSKVLYLVPLFNTSTLIVSPL